MATRASGTGGRAFSAGLAGAATVTVLNELGRRTIRGAPRAELLGVRAVGALARAAGVVPSGEQAFLLALAAEVISNGAYYALPALTKRPLAAGIALGALAGAGAVALPPRLGLGRWPTRRTGRTRALTFAWYLAAGVAAGLVARRAASRQAMRGGRLAPHGEPSAESGDRMPLGADEPGAGL